MTGFSIGVDLGGTNLRAASFSLDRGIRLRKKVETRLWLGPRVVAEDICNLIERLVLDEAPDETLTGICVAAPGPLELPIGRFHSPPNLPGWDGFLLREILERRFACPVRLENDANVAAYAEFRLGCGRDLGIDSLVLFTLGTGVGTGIISGGRIVSGANGLACEAGHVSVFPDGERCACGNSGCLELYASATGIKRMALCLAAQGNAPEIAVLFDRTPSAGAAELYELASSGNLQAKSIFERAGRALGLAVAAIVNTLNPSLVVLAGGVSEAWPILAPTIFEELGRRSFIYRLTQPNSAFQQHTVVRQAVLKSDAGLFGAAMLPTFDRHDTIS